MRTTGLIVVAAAAVVNAGNPGYTIRDGKYICDKPNTSYCLGGDIILRCDAYGSGTPGRCSNNLSGYPPLGGVASCYEKLGTYGEAACEKNCVVYATDGPYTLPAELCQPSYTSTSTIQTLTTIYTHHPPAQTTTAGYTNSTSTRGPGDTGKPGNPEESGKPGHPGHPGKPGNSTEPTGYTTKCATIVYPNPTHPGHSVTRTLTYTVPVYPTNTHNPPNHPVPTTFHPVPSGSPPPPPVNNGTYHGGHGGNGGKGDGHQGSSGNQNEAANGGDNGGSAASGSGTKVPISPTSTAVPETVTGGAAMNTVSGMLAVVAIVAAYLL